MACCEFLQLTLVLWLKTHATDLVRSYLRAGQPVDWKFIQERLGHASVVTTMQTYTHLQACDHRQAYNAFVAKREAKHAR